jgi:hypothetical protein
MTIRRMLFASRILKATNAHPEYVMHIDFPGQQWLHECASMLHVYVNVFFVYTEPSGTKIKEWGLEGKQYSGLSGGEY